MHIWKLTINTGFDWEEFDEYLFSKREYAEREAVKHQPCGFHIEKIKVVR